MSAGKKKVWYAVGADTSDLSRDGQKAVNIFKQIGDSAESEGARIDKMYGNMKTALAGYLSFNVAKSFTKEMIKVRAEFQDTEASFKVFLGSADKAASFMKKMQSYAFNNVFEFQDLTKQAAQLLAYQNRVEDIIPIIDKLSNVAAGTKKPLAELVDLYNKAKSQDTLMKQDILQWNKAGIPVVQELAKQYGVAEKAVWGMVSAGKIGFKEIDQLLNDMTSSGGLFAGIMEEKMKTLGDSVGLLQDSIAAMFNELGEKNQEFLRSGILAVNWLVENYEKVGRVLGVIIANYGLYRAAIVATTIAQRIQVSAGNIQAFLSLAKSIKTAKDAQVALNLAMNANPLIKLGSILLTVGGLLWAFAKNSKEAAREVRELEQAVLDEGRQVNTLVARLTNANTKEDERRRILEELKAIQPKIVEGLNAEKIATEQLTAKLKLYNEEQVKRAAYAKLQDDIGDITLRINQGETNKALAESEGIMAINNLRGQIRNKMRAEYQDAWIQEIDAIVASEGTIRNKVDRIISTFTTNNGTTVGRLDLSELKDSRKSLRNLDRELIGLELDADRAQSAVDNFVTTFQQFFDNPTGNDDGDGTEQFYSFSEQLQTAADNVRRLTRELNDLKAGKGNVPDFAEAIKDKAKELKDAQEVFNLLLGRTSGSSSGNTTDWDARIKKEAQERQRAAIDMTFDVQQAQIDAMDEGAGKILAQNQLNYEREMEQIRRQKEDKLARIQEWEKTIWESQGGQGTFVPTTTSLSDSELGQFQVLENAAANTLQLANDKVLADLLKQYQNYEARRVAINDKANSDLAALNSQRTSVLLREIGEEMQNAFGNGNADLLARPMIDAAELAKKGWEDAGEGIATVFSSQFGVVDAEGNLVELLVTPILPDGSVLSPDELEKYVDEVLNGTTNFLEADNLGIILTVDVDPNGEAGERLHQLQEQYYALKTDFDAGLGNDTSVDDAVQVLQEKRQEDLEAIDLEIANQSATFAVWAEQITNMGLEQLRNALKTASHALENNAGNLSEQERATLRAQIKTLQKQLEIAEARDASTSSAEKSKKKWSDTMKVMNEVQDCVNNITSSFDGLDDVTKTALTAAMNIAGGTIAMITGIQALAVTSAEAIKGVERASVILAVIGAAVSILSALFGMTSQAEKNHQQALKEVAEAKLNMQREYNKLLLEEMLLMKSSESIFGEDKIEKAAKAIEAYRIALADLRAEIKGSEPEAPKGFMSQFSFVQDAYNEAMALYNEGIYGLSTVKIKTGSYTTGAWFWKKQHDVYSSALAVYPDLINSEGLLNVERAKAILATQKMSDADKDRLQGMIDLHEQMEKAQEQLRDYLQETFGSLGDGIMDSIVYAIENDGVNAWEKFGEAGASVLEDLGKQIAYSLYFSKKFEKLQEQLEEIYGSGMSEKDIAKAAMDLVGQFYNGIGADMENAQAFMEQWKEEAAKAGFDLWGSTRDASSKGIAAASQDSIDELNGRTTAIQSHTYTIAEGIKILVPTSEKILVAVNGIQQNTAHCQRLQVIERDMSAVKTSLSTIETKGLYLRK